MKERLLDLATDIWALLSANERSYWACECGMYHYIDAVANIAAFNTEELNEQDRDDIVDAVYEGV